MGGQKPEVVEGGIYPARGFSPALRRIDSLAGGFLESPAADVHVGLLKSGSWRSRADLEVCPTMPQRYFGCGACGACMGMAGLGPGGAMGGGADTK